MQSQLSSASFHQRWILLKVCRFCLRDKKTVTIVLNACAQERNGSCYFYNRTNSANRTAIWYFTVLLEYLIERTMPHCLYLMKVHKHTFLTTFLLKVSKKKTTTTATEMTKNNSFSFILLFCVSTQPNVWRSFARDMFVVRIQFLFTFYIVVQWWIGVQVRWSTQPSLGEPRQKTKERKVPIHISLFSLINLKIFYILFWFT